MSDKPEQSHWQTTSREEREQSRVSRAVTNVMDASRSAWNRTRVFAKGELDVARDLKDHLSVKWAEMRAGMLPKRTSLEATAEARANYHRHVLQREPAPLVERTFGEPLTQWAARRDQPSSQGPSLEQIHERLTVAYLASRASVSPGPEYEAVERTTVLQRAGERVQEQFNALRMEYSSDQSDVMGRYPKMETLHALKEEIARADRSGDRTVDLARVPNPESGVAQAWASALREDGVHVKDAPRTTAVEPATAAQQTAPDGAFVTGDVMSRADAAVFKAHATAWPIEPKGNEMPTHTLEQFRDRFSEIVSKINAGPTYEGDLQPAYNTAHSLLKEADRAIISGDRAINVTALTGTDTPLGRHWVERLSDAGVTITEGARETKAFNLKEAEAQGYNGHLPPPARDPVQENWPQHEWRTSAGVETRVLTGQSDEGHHFKLQINTGSHENETAWSRPFKTPDLAEQAGLSRQSREHGESAAPKQSLWKNDRREEARATAMPQGRAPGSEMPVQGRQMRM